MSLKQYKAGIRRAMGNPFLREAMQNFTAAYRTGRESAFHGLDVDEMVAQIAAIKDAANLQLDGLYQDFKKNAEAAGIKVHLAETALEANEIITHIGRINKVRKIVKSKTMTGEEILLNHHLGAQGFEVTETDLGEWIIQLRREGPSHMVMPAIHLSRHHIAHLFSDVTGAKQHHDIAALVKVARRELRLRYMEADMGITGANFALAATGTLGLITNEGNARLVTTLPRVHIALVGLEKLLPSLSEALTINRMLPRNATGQAITSYVTWITGANIQGSEPSSRKTTHVVFLDNGRRALARDPLFSQVLRCVRCGACANVCPVFRVVGGHQYGYIYVGAIGLVLTYFFHGREKARHLVKNCINCEACRVVCAAGIDLPLLIKAVHARIQDEEGHPLKNILIAGVMGRRKWFHATLRGAGRVQGPLTGGSPYLRHLPLILTREHNFRTLPAMAPRPFRDRWKVLKPHVENPSYRVALFAGCLHDFVYPEQLQAAVTLLADFKVDVDFPMAQSCCGLPLETLGETKAARDVARQNVMALNPECYDVILALCASCAAHLKNRVPRILEGVTPWARRAQGLAERVMPLSAFLYDVLQMNSADLKPGKVKTTYHAPCHLCRGLGIKEAPRLLIQRAGFKFVRAEEEETCCGFGGTYSTQFPQVSSQILSQKLDDIKKTGAQFLVTECPGCILQLRGGILHRGDAVEVLHLAELLDRLKK